MNNPTLIIGFILLGIIWWNLSVGIRIMKYLKSKGREVSLSDNGIFVRGRIFRYLPLYKKVSQQTEGKVGLLYNEFYVSFTIMVLLFITGVLTV